uniref:Carboxymethylenebutenolidase homolog n=1 Tax=Pavo cristatus TaxID=9049 RepID=A0A8C9G3Y5_PAVCR
MANELRPCPCDIGDKFDYGGRGQEIQVEHIKAYVSKPSTSTDKAVIVIHDIFGWELPNTRYIADMLTANGYVAICPDFFVGQEAWKPSNDWAIFYDWVKSRDAGKIDKYNSCSLFSLWMCLFRRNFCLSKDTGLGLKLLLCQIQLDVQKQKFHAVQVLSLWLCEGCFLENKSKSDHYLVIQRVEGRLISQKKRITKSWGMHQACSTSIWFSSYRQAQLLWASGKV